MKCIHAHTCKIISQPPTKFKNFISVRNIFFNKIKSREREWGNLSMRLEKILKINKTRARLLKSYKTTIVVLLQYPLRLAKKAHNGIFMCLWHVLKIYIERFFLSSNHNPNFILSACQRGFRARSGRRDSGFS